MIDRSDFAHVTVVKILCRRWRKIFYLSKSILTGCGSIHPNLNRISITGLVGSLEQLFAQLVVRRVAVRAVVRRLDSVARDTSDIEFVPVGNIGVATNWSSVVAIVDCVIHCAARAHVMHETNQMPSRRIGR